MTRIIYSLKSVSEIIFLPSYTVSLSHTQREGVGMEGERERERERDDSSSQCTLQVLVLYPEVWKGSKVCKVTVQWAKAP